MAIFALGDLHLSESVDKPMGVFGDEWQDHSIRMANLWRERVAPADLVLIPGDISWAMTLQEAEADLHWIRHLPGRKVMIRGNHDYWWSGISKVRRMLGPDEYAIQNDAIALDGYAICGSRGWTLPSHPKSSEEDLVIYRREVERLRLSLEQAKTMELPIIAMLHFPPMGSAEEETGFTELLEAYQVALCIYGHLHGQGHRFAVEGLVRGVAYQLVSADYIGFGPVPLHPLP